MSDCQTNTNTPDVKVSGIIKAPIDQVWATVGEFNALPTLLPHIWDGSTVEGSGVGAVRTLTNNEGGEIIEQLEDIDCEGAVRSVEFSILGGNFADLLPVDYTTYLGTLQLEDIGHGRTRFTWSASYDVKEGFTENDAKSLLTGIFSSALESLRTIHEPQRICCAIPDVDLVPIADPDASIEVVINAPADAVWATIGNFDALPHYLPNLWDDSVVDGKGVGAVRTLTDTSGARIVEELLEYDGVGDSRSLKFSILESEDFPLPFETDTYLAFMQVEALSEDQSLFTWSASYEPLIDPADAAAALEGLFNVAAENLKLIHEDPAVCSDLEVGLYDARTDTLIQMLEEGDELLASTLHGRPVTIVAFVPEESVFSTAVESMALDLNDGSVTRVENVEPYALFGDIRENYRGGSLPVGDTSITFDLYSEDYLGGDLLGTITRTFTIVNDL